MKLSYWIYFDSPGEKKQLAEIINSNTDEITINLKLQEAFNIDVLTAQRVIETYKKHIKK